MDWLRNIIDKKEAPTKRTSVTKKTSNEKRFHVRNSDKKILVAHKSPTGNGFVYRSNGPNGPRNVHVNGNLYKTEEEAKKKQEKLRKQEKS